MSDDFTPVHARSGLTNEDIPVVPTLPVTVHAERAMGDGRMGFLTEDRDRPAGSRSASAAALRQPCAPLVLVIEETQALSRAVGFLCGYLGVHVETAGARQDLRALFAARRPIAVLAPADTPDQDGCRLLRQVAEYDRDLPVMLVTGRNPVLLSAIEAVEAVLSLSAVQKMMTIPGIGDLADFFSKAGQRRAR